MSKYVVIVGREWNIKRENSWRQFFLGITAGVLTALISGYVLHYTLEDRKPKEGSLRTEIRKEELCYIYSIISDKK